MWLEAFLFIISFFLLIYLLNLSNNKGKDFWSKHGIDFIDTSKIASTFQLLIGSKDMEDVDEILYKEIGDRKFCGIMDSGTPILIVKDVDLLKTIFIKDFDHFVDRKILFSNASAKQKSLLTMLPSLSGSAWRSVRVTMSPTFTTGKMRRLMEFFNASGKEWVDYIRTKSEASSFSSVPPINITNVAGQYALDVIATAVFGLTAGSIKDPNSKFVQEASKFGDSSILQVIKQSLALRFPKLFKLLDLDPLDKSMTTFFDGVFTAALEARESGRSEPRNDFLQLIVEARKGALKAEGNDELDQFEKEALLKDKPDAAALLDDDVARGQGLIFFIAGYHGISLTVAYSVHALASHPEMQDKLRAEIDKVFATDGTIGYDHVNNLEYLDMFISEILRFYPITQRLTRICTKEYNNKEFGLKIPKGTVVEFPFAMIHKDPRYYHNPEGFDPEHFNKTNKLGRSQYAYIPFGHGPRNCIGMKFAQVEIKTMLAHIIRNFTIEKDATTPAFPLKTKLVGQAYFIVGDVPVKLVPRKR